MFANANALRKQVETPSRRTQERVQVHIPCSFVLNDDKFGTGVTIDLANSGVGIKSKVKPKKGDKIHILFKNYGEHQGRVARTYRGGFGVILPNSSLAILALSIDNES